MVRRLGRKRNRESSNVALCRGSIVLVACAIVIWGSWPTELIEVVNNTGTALFEQNLEDNSAMKEDTAKSPCNCTPTKCADSTLQQGQAISAQIASETQAAVKTQQWEDWPAIAYQEVEHDLVTKGDNFFHHARELYLQPTTNDSKETLFDEFLRVYKARPDPVNMCGIRINHAMALFLAVKMIQPTLVVESGVNQGVSTYFIRAASSTTKIFAIDPMDKPICEQGERWIDSSDLTTNLTGEKNFVDLLALDWKGMIDKGEVDPDKTLIFIDDHLHAFQRIAGVLRHGVRHIVVEDNYKFGEGATQLDKKSTPKQYFKAQTYRVEANWLFRNMKSYAEFPPLVPPIMAKAFPGERKKAGGFMVASDPNNDIVHPILRPDTNQEDLKLYNRVATELGLNPSLEDNDSYMQMMNYNQICYLELLPVPRILLD